MKNNSITITYLSKVSFASLNGADKEVDNINPIKKVTLHNGEELPYVSSQALRRALRDGLASFGWNVSPVGEASEKKGAAKTAADGVSYIDDDLFGFMDAQKETITRTSPVRVDALLALSSYKGDLDFGTNFMAKTVGGTPNIFETEIHSGIYRGSIMIELDRVGCGEGFKDKEISKEEKAKRVIALIDAFQMLWSSGRQSRFLADISPKFIAAAYMKAKNPVFLEAVDVNTDGKVDITKLQSVASDYERFISNHIFAAQEGVFSKEEGVSSLKDGFDSIKSWILDYYEQTKK